MQDQPAAIRWTWRILVHAVDGNAWIGSAITSILGVVWLVESQSGLSLPPSANRALATAIGYWSGPASLLVLIGVLIQAAARAGMDEQREGSALSPAHIQDLQRQAEAMSRTIYMPHNYVRLDTASIAAHNLIQHFPDVAIPIGAWNESVEEWLGALKALSARHDREALKPINGMTVQMSGVMMAVATGAYSSPLDVTWGVQMPGGPSSEIHNLMFIDPKMAQDVTVATIPRDIDAFVFADHVQRRLLEARIWPEAIRVREADHRLGLMRSELSKRFEAILLNHQPGGRCDTCRPPMKKATARKGEKHGR